MVVAMVHLRTDDKTREGRRAFRWPAWIAAFAGSIPGLYDRYLVPLLFQPYAEEVARRAQAFQPGHVLETAAGTGVVTAALHQALPDAEIVATDLNPDDARSRRSARFARTRSASKPADAQDLPFADETFDLVVCQFGVMFFPDKVRGNAEAQAGASRRRPLLSR